MDGGSGNRKDGCPFMRKPPILPVLVALVLSQLSDPFNAPISMKGGRYSVPAEPESDASPAEEREALTDYAREAAEPVTLKNNK